MRRAVLLQIRAIQARTREIVVWRQASSARKAGSVLLAISLGPLLILTYFGERCLSRKANL